MKGKAILISIILLLASMGTVAAADLVVGDLKVEALENPIGIDAISPRFSWRIYSEGERNVMQHSYHIMVASTQEKLDSGDADIWNSGVVESDQSQWILYEGEPLERSSYY